MRVNINLSVWKYVFTTSGWLNHKHSQSKRGDKVINGYRFEGVLCGTYLNQAENVQFVTKNSIVLLPNAPIVIMKNSCIL